MEENEFHLHINFTEIQTEMDKLQADSATANNVFAFVNKLKDMTARVESTIKRETSDERELWDEYKQLQGEKLVVLDLSHEWDYISETIKDKNPKFDMLIKDAIEELKDHIGVLTESHRAHIDILEIYYTRKIEVLALVITAVVSYLAVWEFFVRDLLSSIRFPDHLSPALNYLVVVISLAPIFVTLGWAWINRKSYF